MKAIAKILLGAGLVLALLATSVAMLGSQAEPLPPVDPSMLISMPDGTSLPLEAFVAQAEEETLEDVVASSAGDVEPSSPPSHPDAEVDPERLVEELFRGPITSRTYLPGLLGHADRLLDEGKVDEALAVLQSIGPGDDHYARAQRKIGWDVMTKEKGQAARGVAYVNRCLAEDPFSGNAWEDATRVWSRTLGVPVN